MNLTLNLESAAVLLRALTYGECAISTHQIRSGEARVIQHNTNLLREQICTGICRHVIEHTAKEEREKQ